MVDPVRALQHALYRAAKADPGRRFDALRDKVQGRLVAGVGRGAPQQGRARHRQRPPWPLSIPTVRDRIVQAAVKIVLEPIFEADMLPCSFGFRPRRSAHDALQVLVDESQPGPLHIGRPDGRGRRWVVETDIAN
jgi:RNA-directed DNA polymerase